MAAVAPRLPTGDVFRGERRGARRGTASTPRRGSAVVADALVPPVRELVSALAAQALPAGADARDHVVACMQKVAWASPRTLESALLDADPSEYLPRHAELCTSRVDTARPDRSGRDRGHAREGTPRPLPDLLAHRGSARQHHCVPCAPPWQFLDASTAAASFVSTYRHQDCGDRRPRSDDIGAAAFWLTTGPGQKTGGPVNPLPGVAAGS